MMDVLQPVLAFILALGVLVTVHEFGHFWVARRLGVKILRFSVGFGRPLWSKRVGEDATEFAIAAIPLGGYVKMLDEREGVVRSDELHRAFNRQSLAKRTAIVVAGPLFNFLFAIVAYWIMFVVGIPGLKPILGDVTSGSPAAEAGLEPGMQIVAIDGDATPTWERVLQVSIKRVLDRGAATLRVRDARGYEQELTVDLSSLHVDDVTQGNFFDKLGTAPARPHVPPVIGEVVAGGAAQRADLRAGDRIIEADGKPIVDWEAWVEYVRARPDKEIHAEIERAGERLKVALVPERERSGGADIGKIGAAVDRSALPSERDTVAIEQYPVIEALGKAAAKTWDMSWLTLKILGKMLFGEASVENLSGPISIAQFAGQSAKIGAGAFLSFLAIVSVSLGVLNLLPIPLLDGGHLLYYLVEFVTRRPVSENVQAYGQQIGLVVLMGLMGIAFYNDLMRIF